MNPLQLWDWSTGRINKFWSQIPESRFQEQDIAFGQYVGKTSWHLFCSIGNEIHHREQGYVYLRSLGIEPLTFGSGNESKIGGKAAIMRIFLRESY